MSDLKHVLNLSHKHFVYSGIQGNPVSFKLKFHRTDSGIVHSLSCLYIIITFKCIGLKVLYTHFFFIKAKVFTI